MDSGKKGTNERGVISPDQQYKGCFPMLPPISVLICTYNRPREIARTIKAFNEFVIYGGELQYIICDDSSPDSYPERIWDSLGKKLTGELAPRYVTTSKNSGWGANVNNGLAYCGTDYIFFLEDDYVLTKPLNLSIGVATMEHNPNLGMIRYRGTAGDHLVYHQFEADVSKYEQGFYQGIGVEGKVSYLQIDSGSPSLYLYSHGPHLKHRRFHEFYGFYPTGLKLGQTEEYFAHIVKDQMVMPDAPAIAIFPDWIPMAWDHIGESYQLTELDKGFTPAVY